MVPVSLGLLVGGCKMEDRMQPKPMQSVDVVVEVAEAMLDGGLVDVEGAIGISVVSLEGVEGVVGLPLVVTELVGTVESVVLAPVGDESVVGILFDVDESVVV
jgi:hypothetical protein